MNAQFTRLAAAALLALGAASVSASDVTIYGIIDTGLNYQHVDQDKTNTDATNQFQMKGSQSIPSRWGFRGSEDLGNGYKVGFTLESQFQPDSGALMPGSRLFHRAAQVQISKDTLGTLVMGRSGALRSGFGTTGLWAVKINPFSNSWGDFTGGSKYIMPGGFKSVDNAVTYQSPVWAGFQVSAQYSLKIDAVSDTTGVEGKATSDRQWGVGATYTQGPLHLAAVLDSVQYNNQRGTKDGKAYDNSQYDDSLAFSLGGHYDFGVLKLYASGMYFKGMKASEFQGHTALADIASGASYKGYSLQIGTSVPVLGGNVLANVGWMDAEVDQDFRENKDLTDVDRLLIGLAYTYPLSKRTSLYVGTGYVKDSSNTLKDSDPSAYEAMAGMVHRF